MRTTLFLLTVLAALAVFLKPLPVLGADSGRVFVYLGHATDDGKLTGAKFDGVPLVKTSLEANTSTSLKSPVTITTTEGVRARKERSPKADAVGRFPRGAKVKLFTIHNDFGYVWGEVEAVGMLLAAAK